jgi:hypothetical protein
LHKFQDKTEAQLILKQRQLIAADQS